MFYGTTPFSVAPFSSLGITSIKSVSTLEVVATLIADGSVTHAAAASISAAAILEADGTLTLGGSSAELYAIVDILAKATLRTSDAKIFIWTTPSRPTTWTIPTEVGVTTWVLPQVGVSTWVLPK